MRPNRNIKLLLLLTILLITRFTEAFENRQTGARSVGIAGSGVALTGVETIFINQAAMAYVSNFSVLTVYESKFLLKEFSYMAIGTIIPSSVGTFGASYAQFGREIYKETKAGLAFSRTFSDKFSAGLQFSYLAKKVPENRDPFQSVTVEGGILVKFSERLNGAIHWFNPFMSSLNTPGGKQKIPWIFKIGEAWQISPHLIWCIDLDKLSHLPWNVRTGIEYYPVQSVSIRAGVKGNPFQPTGGAGFNFGKVTFDIGFSYHGNLGFSPTAGLCFSL